MSEYDDIAELVELVQSGDEKAFEKLVHSYEKLVYYIILQNVRNSADARDIAQETFIEVKKSIKNLNEPKYFKAWLNRVIFSKMSRHYKKHYDIPIDAEKSPLLQNMWEERAYMLPQKQAHIDNDKNVLYACIEKLKPIYRDVIVLRYFEELSLQEIAYALQIPEGTVKSRLYSGKDMLKEYILEYEKEHDISLDFKSSSLEIALVSAFVASWDAFQIPNTVAILPWKKFTSKATALKPALATLVCGSIAVTGIGLATHYGQPQKESKKIALSKPQYQEVEKFPEVMYHNESITTARQAYMILFDLYLQDSLNADEDSKLLYQTLMEFGGSYADLFNEVV